MNLSLPGIEPSAFERDFPTPDAADDIRDEQLFHRAVGAYRYFYPTVSLEGILNGNREAGLPDNSALMILDAGPRHVAFTANSDTPYASAVLDLDALGPVVIELPPGPYIGLANDRHQRWILDMGIPGPDAGKGGKHLIVPPGFTGNLPAGHQIGGSPTRRILIAVRALPLGGDVAGALDALRKVKIYPLGKPSAALGYVDATPKTFDATLLAWEGSVEYWRRLHGILDEEPIVEDLLPMYGDLAAVGIRKGAPFQPDARMRDILEAAAKVAAAEMRVEAFASARPDRLVWPDRRWEWVGLVPDDGNFETKDFLDLAARDRWFFQAIVASPAMFRRKAGAGSVYFLAARDQSGAFLDGGKSYRLSVPAPVPASLFWSVTAYDAKTRSQVQTPQDRAVVGSLKDRLGPGSDGAIEICFGPTAPGNDKPWIQTPAGRGFFLYFRIYGPEAAALDGSWKLADLART